MKSQSLGLYSIAAISILVLGLLVSSCGGGTPGAKTSNTKTTSSSSAQEGLPDLIIEKVTVEPGLEVAVGTMVKFHLTIKNIGTGYINSSFYILLGNNGGFSGGIQAGETKEVTVAWLASSAGTYDIIWTADYGKRVLEANEDNNESEKTTIVVR
jgi:subtilase family serine protease